MIFLFHLPFLIKWELKNPIVCGIEPLTLRALPPKSHRFKTTTPAYNGFMDSWDEDSDEEPKVKNQKTPLKTSVPSSKKSESKVESEEDDNWDDDWDKSEATPAPATVTKPPPLNVSKVRIFFDVQVSIWEHFIAQSHHSLYQNLSLFKRVIHHFYVCHSSSFFLILRFVYFILHSQHPIWKCFWEKLSRI